MKGDFCMELRKLFSVFMSFMFLVTPGVSKAMNEEMKETETTCLICNEDLPASSEKRVKLECNHEFCKEHLIEWWGQEEKKALKKKQEFRPICPTCSQEQTEELCEGIFGQCTICLGAMTPARNPVEIDHIETDRKNHNHKFCRECIKGYWNTRKKECQQNGTEFKPDCLYCRGTVPDNTYKTVLSEEVLNLDICPICQNTLPAKAEDTIKTTKCGHTFCKKCLERWFEEKNSCPMCRTEDPCNRDRDMVDMYWANRFYDHNYDHHIEINNDRLDEERQSMAEQDYEEYRNLNQDSPVTYSRTYAIREGDSRDNSEVDGGASDKNRVEAVGLPCAVILAWLVGACLVEDQNKNIKSVYRNYCIDDFDLGGLLERDLIEVEVR